MRIFDNCESKLLLKEIFNAALSSEKWHIKIPLDRPFEKKFFKLDIMSDRSFIDQSANDTYLTGLCRALFFQLYESNSDLFHPEKMLYCGISCKTSQLDDVLHIDYRKSDEAIKFVGVLNDDWDPDVDGGDFIWGDERIKMYPGRFVFFDPSVMHGADRIKTDKIRVALDFTAVPKA